MKNFLNEAFKSLRELNEEAFDLSADKDRLDELKSFIDDDVEEPEEEIIDLEAEDESQLNPDNRVGKVVLKCEVCGSEIYKDPREVTVDEETETANLDDPCPICKNNLGYTIKGKYELVPWPEDDEEFEDIDVEDSEYEKSDEDIEDEEAYPDDDIDTEEDEEEDEEGKTKRESYLAHKRRHLRKIHESKVSKKSVNSIYDSLVREELEDEEDLNEDDEYIDGNETPDDILANESLKESVEVKATGEDEVNVTKDDEGNLNINVGSESIQEGDEFISPLSTEEQEDIMNPEDEESDNLGFEEPLEEPAEGESEESIEDGEEDTEGSEEIPEEPTEGEDEEIENIKEESFNRMASKFVHKTYSNVSGFKTTGYKTIGNNLVVEGVIKYKSGNEVKSKFVFTEGKAYKSGKVSLIGYNKTFSNSKKAFTVKGSLYNSTLLPESFKYNYIAKGINESKEEITRVSGVIK